MRARSAGRFRCPREPDEGCLNPAETFGTVRTAGPAWLPTSNRAPILTDGAVILKGFSLRDAADHLAGEDEEQARRFGWYPKRSTPDTVRRAIRRWQRNWRRSEFRRAWAARDATSGELVGGCELRLQGGGLAHVSYWTLRDYRRRGFASRATRLACDLAFSEWGINTIEAHVEPDNLASRKTALRAGFLEFGLLQRPGMVDMVVFRRKAP